MENLSNSEISNIIKNSKEEFYIKNFELIDDIFDNIKDYCEDNYLFIFDKCNSSYELNEFIKNNTYILDNIIQKNINDEIDYKNNYTNTIIQENEYD